MILGYPILGHLRLWADFYDPEKNIGDIFGS